MDEKRYWLLWDGDCDFCRRSVAWVRCRDRDNRFQVIPYQTAPSPPMTPALYARSRLAVQVVCPDGSVREGGRAVELILRVLGRRRIAWVLRAPLIRTVTDWGYGLVAKNRGIIGRILRVKPCRGLHR